ncbi:RNA polymerase I-specific transcription-initiation factor-domain-containing protein [Terfezia claveryi]|nr:RNA polymerase I-specific transcription-initiation factor-domain-containing protein [Terfezia claveryi]
MSVDSILPAVYDPKGRKWVSTRQYGQGTILHPLGSAKIHFSAQNSSAHQTLSGKYANGAGTLHVDRARKWSRYLMHDIPELAPALDILPDFIEESHIITASTEVNDPSVGRLMDVGSAAIVGDDAGAVRTLIYAMGPAGGEVGVGRIIDEGFKFPDGDWKEREGEVNLIAPGLDDRHGDRQRGEYRVVGKVRQVRTAKGNNSPLLALRTATTSTILTQEYTSHNSKFTLTPLLTIPTSGSPHSDLAFSPYNHRHLGIVDERGAWFVRDLHTQSPALVAAGDELANTPHGHSWGRIHWGADENSLIVSNRARVGLFDTRAQPPGLSFLPINTSVARDWVLDTAPIPTRTNSHHALILTSSSLLWIDTRMPGKRLLSQDHFRHTDDVSLKMELFSLPGKGGEGVTALVYSRMNPLVSAFQMGYSDGEGGGEVGVPLWLDNPYLWKMDMDRKGTANAKSGGLLSLSILPVRIGMDDGEGDGCGGKMLGVSCWSYERDGVVRSRIYTSGDMGEPIPIDDHDHDNAQEPHTRPEGGDNFDMEQTPWDHNTPRLLHTDFSPLYKYIFTDTFFDPTLKTAEGDSAIEDFKTQLQQQLLIEGEEGVDGLLKKGGVKTLFDIYCPQHLFGDLSMLSTSLKTLLNEINDSKEVEVTGNLIPISEGFPFREEVVREGEEEGEDDDDKADSDIPSLYNHLFTSYVAPLPPEVPTRVRLQRERLARMIATELYLASYGTVTTSNPTTNPATNPPLFTPLQKYTPLTNHLPTSKLPSSLSRILDQWSIGEDPEDFEYEVDGAPTPKKAYSKLSRARSYGEKKRGGKGSDSEGDPGRKVSMFSGSQPAMFAVSAATQPTTPSRGLGGGEGRGWASQTPMTPGKRTQSPEKNSTAGGFGASMSQVERGKFGGRKRPPVKKRRKQGF